MTLINQIGLEQYEKTIRENERMKTGLRAIRSFAENSVFGGWRFKVAALVDDAMPSPRPRSAPEAPRPPEIAPPAPQALRDTSPGRGDTSGGPDVQRVRQLGGFPSKLCQDILRALAHNSGATADDIGKYLGVPHGAGQITGATSNMVNKMGRHWIRFEHLDGERIWFITDRGREILALSYKYPPSDR